MGGGGGRGGEGENEQNYNEHSLRIITSIHLKCFSTHISAFANV